MVTGWHGDGDFAECTTEKHSAKVVKVAECQDENTRQSFSTLPSVKTKTLGTISKLYRVSRLKHSAKFINFAECHGHNTRQSLVLPSVTRSKHLANNHATNKFMVTLPSVHYNTLGKIKTLGKEGSQITENSLVAECFALTLGNSSFCRVLHSAKRPRPPPFLLICHI